MASTTNIPINTFNKVWIIPEKAEVYEKGNLALITDAGLEVMLEEDYLALKNSPQSIVHKPQRRNKVDIGEINKIGSQRLKETILPVIKDEVNKGENFAKLRQMYYSLILATWFKRRLKDSIYQYYIDQKKIKGIDLEDPGIKEKIYHLYLESFKKGVYDYIKTEREPYSRKRLKRRYYSGGIVAQISSVIKYTSQLNVNGLVTENYYRARIELVPPDKDNHPLITSSPMHSNETEDDAWAKIEAWAEARKINDQRFNIFKVITDKIDIIKSNQISEGMKLLIGHIQKNRKSLMDNIATIYGIRDSLIDVIKAIDDKDIENFPDVLKEGKRGEDDAIEGSASAEKRIVKDTLELLRKMLPESSEQLSNFERDTIVEIDEDYKELRELLRNIAPPLDGIDLNPSNLPPKITSSPLEKDIDIQEWVKKKMAEMDKLEKEIKETNSGSPFGGIDLDPSNLPLKTGSSPFQFNLATETLQLWRKTEGLTFRILSIEPVAGWEKLLGAEK